MMSYDDTEKYHNHFKLWPCGSNLLRLLNLKIEKGKTLETSSVVAIRSIKPGG